MASPGFEVVVGTVVSRRVCGVVGFATVLPLFAASRLVAVPWPPTAARPQPAAAASGTKAADGGSLAADGAGTSSDAGSLARGSSTTDVGVVSPSALHASGPAAGSGAGAGAGAGAGSGAGAGASAGAGAGAGAGADGVANDSASAASNHATAVSAAAEVVRAAASLIHCSTPALAPRAQASGTLSVRVRGGSPVALVGSIEDGAVWVDAGCKPQPRSEAAGDAPAKHRARTLMRHCTRVGNVVCAVFRATARPKRTLSSAAAPTAAVTSSGSSAPPGAAAPGTATATAANMSADAAANMSADTAASMSADAVTMQNAVTHWQVLARHVGRGFTPANVEALTDAARAALRDTGLASVAHAVAFGADGLRQAQAMFARKARGVDATGAGAATAGATTAGAAALCRRWAIGRCTRASMRPAPGEARTGEAGLCPYRHYFADAAEEARYAALAERSAADVADARARKRQRHEREHEHEHEEGSVSGGGTALLPKAARANIFADWVVERWGVAALSAGSGVVDVAGGKGLVASRLALAHGVPVTVLDPVKRKRVPPKKVAKALRKAGRTHLLRYVHDWLRSPGESGSSDDAVVQLLEHASLIIGMHPDQATEPIVDGALAYSKDFAVVPCCVFPDLFPHRRIPAGGSTPDTSAGGEEAGTCIGTGTRPVITTDDFITYLVRKARSGFHGEPTTREVPRDREVAIATLPFEGRNRVVFATGACTPD